MSKSHWLLLYQINAVFIVDAPSDFECAIQAGCQPVLVLTGRGRSTVQQIKQYPVKIPIYKDMSENVELIDREFYF